jgi:hypothetical protein
MPEPLTRPTQMRLEHAEAARLWLLSAADQTDAERWPKQKRSLIDLGRLIVADAKERTLPEVALVADESQDTTLDVAQYDAWLIWTINQQLERCKVVTSNVANPSQTRFSQFDLELALRIRQRTRTEETKNTEMISPQRHKEH